MRPFTVRVDAWLVVVLAATGAILIWSFWMAYQDGWELVLLAGAACLPGLLIAGLIVPIHYAVGEGQVHVRAGVIHWRIKAADIVRVVPHHGLKDWRQSLGVISAAPSVRALRVEYGRRRSVIISPEDQVGFLDAVAALDAGLVVRGDRVERPQELVVSR